MQLSREQKIVHDWNRKYCPGQKVRVVIGGSVVHTTTRGSAAIYPCNTPGIMLCGHSGVFSLDRITPVQGIPVTKKEVSHA